MILNINYEYTMSEYKKRIDDRESLVNYESTLRISEKRYSENNSDKIEKDFLLSIGRERLEARSTIDVHRCFENTCLIFSITDLSEDDAILY